ncbi:amidohydrolase [Chitinophaga costaii]|nr:amidohydrolase [Chitinophaga costaii]
MPALLWPGGFCVLAGLLWPSVMQAQQTFPVNGVADPRINCYAFTHATLVKDPQTTLANATLVIREGRIVTAAPGAAVPLDAVVIDCKGKYIYPSFIDLYSDYGVTVAPRAGRNYGAGPQFISSTKGAYNWNQAIRAEVNASALFAADFGKAATLREAGFGTVLTHAQDGIARGSGAVVTLAAERENKVLLKARASAHYTFNKGSSTQDYPGSLMGCIALLRQTYLDAQWYKSQPAREGQNLSLQAWNENQSLPQIFEAADKWNVLRADKIGDEFGVQYIFKAGGNEYQRLPEMAATKGTFILPVNFPAAYDVEDPNDARFLALSDMKHWELAPTEPGAFEKAGIPFCLTAADLKDVKSFLANVRKAIDYGLTPEKALEALTRVPASLLKISDQVGTLEPGKLANFLVTSGPLFNENTVLYQNWVQGIRYVLKNEGWQDIRGTYTLSVNGPQGNSQYTLLLKGSANTPALVVLQQDSIAGTFNIEDQFVKIAFPLTKNGSRTLRLSGLAGAGSWNGTGLDTSGNPVKWTSTYANGYTPTADSSKKKVPADLGKIYYPFLGDGFETKPKQQDILIKNATVWTSESESVLPNTDVLLRGGKIAQIGKNLAAANARVIDGTGKYLTAGIIDEHSHIAISSGVNEGSQSVTSEVRIADVINPEDINIYRQLSGGVTTSHLLHGSANTIGGQSQLVKLRWGANAEEMKFTNWDPFIKFALGENVKQSNWGDRQRERFPQTRMGVEQVLYDAFTRAHDYDQEGPGKRRDLELDALVEILHHKRFITCHSYVQSEINMLMHTADHFGFTINTFTHILEGYKVADKMKAHGAGAGTFADWWAYKMEVLDAIPYNAMLMQQEGLTVAINSDDAEMARRLNQEAAKTVKYGGNTEADAWKMVTINPAKLLHIADRVGSIKTGKDADVVLWSDNPLSIYAKAEKTIVDGIVYFDRDLDTQMHQRITAEKNRLVQKMLAEKKKGGGTQKAVPTRDDHYHCEDLQGGHQNDLLDGDAVAEAGQ